MCMDRLRRGTSGNRNRNPEAAISSRNPDRSVKDIEKAAKPEYVTAAASKASNWRRLPSHLRHAHHLSKPQLHFQEAIDNRSQAAFVPKLKHKWHARVPWTPKLVAVSSTWKSYLNSVGMTDNELPAERYQHPYLFEIQTLHYPSHMLEHRPEIIFPPLERTPLTWVDSESALQTLASLLDSQLEFAVDLEAHDYRSFQGLTCLMQISTRQEDFFIDTLSLREQMSLLGSVFANPNIVKVFHGAEMDNLWLQRDFGLYIVNLFDTYHASRTLQFERHSLAHLLKHYADVDVDKKYQMADWRIRPLPAEMSLYARQDTHYLLYIYDRMRNELLVRSQSNGPVDSETLIDCTLRLSAETCLKTYVKPHYSPVSYLITLDKLSARDSMTQEEVVVFKHLHAFRDSKARDLDESVRFVLSNYSLLLLSKAMPTTSHDVVEACANQGSSVVRSFAQEVVQCVKKARQEFSQVSKPDMASTRGTEPPVGQRIRFDNQGRQLAIETNLHTESSTIAKVEPGPIIEAIPLATQSAVLGSLSDEEDKTLCGPLSNPPLPSHHSIKNRSNLLGGTSDDDESNDHDEVVQKDIKVAVSIPKAEKTSEPVSKRGSTSVERKMPTARDGSHYSGQLVAISLTSQSKFLGEPSYDEDEDTEEFGGDEKDDNSSAAKCSNADKILYEIHDQVMQSLVPESDHFGDKHFATKARSDVTENVNYKPDITEQELKTIVLSEMGLQKSRKNQQPVQQKKRKGIHQDLPFTEIDKEIDYRRAIPGVDTKKVKSIPKFTSPIQLPETLTADTLKTMVQERGIDRLGTQPIQLTTRASRKKNEYDVFGDVKIDPAFTKPDPRLSTHVRAGSKQMTFKPNINK